MGFLKRLFPFNFKSKLNTKKDKVKQELPASSFTSSSTNDLPTPTSNSDLDVAMNRLLRTSSTHFSVLSETEYTDLPPISHPINNVLRPPSRMSCNSKMSTSSYTVTIHSRTLHSCTEFPNANGKTTPSYTGSTPGTPGQQPKVTPPLTPGDRTRLMGLRQDASVSNLVNIYDHTGHPTPEAFSNTPAPPKRHRTESTLRMLLGEMKTSSLVRSKTSIEESDLTWAERCIADDEDVEFESRPNSSDSSLKVHNNLFDRSASPEGGDSSYSADEPALAECFHEINNSLRIELATSTDGAIILKETMTTLTTPSRGTASLLDLLNEKSETSYPRSGVSKESESLVITSPQLPMSTLRCVTNRPQSPQPMRSPGGSLYIRDGPKELFTQISPAPGRRQAPLPLPPIPLDYQFRSPGHRSTPEHGSPTHVLQESREHGSKNRVSSVAISIASSIRPEIETTMDVDNDPYTPIPKRVGLRKRGRDDAMDEASPTRAPFKGRVRKYPEYAQSHRKKENAPSPKRRRYSPPENRDKSMMKTLDVLRTPMKNTSLLRQLNHKPPARPSPPSSTELSPEGRRIMTTIRAEKRNIKDTSTRRIEPIWQPLTDT